MGIETYDVTPETHVDVGLSERANRANKKFDEAKKKGKTAFLISVHVNAASNEGWHNATGWSVWTTVGKTSSDTLADCLYEGAKEILSPLGKRIRTDMSDGDVDYESNFTVLYKAKCSAVLTENFF